MARKSSTTKKPTSKSKPQIGRRAAKKGPANDPKSNKAGARSKSGNVTRARIGTAFEALPQLHPIADDSTRMVSVQWDSKAKLYRGSVIHVEEAKAIAAVSHPPTITPVPNDPNHVVRCDWDIQANRYRCDIIDATDPRARV